MCQGPKIVANCVQISILAASKQLFAKQGSSSSPVLVVSDADLGLAILVLLGAAHARPGGVNAGRSREPPGASCACASTLHSTTQHV